MNIDQWAEGDVARPPMANGEWVFAAPWEGRVFGMAHVLADGGVFTWDEFRERLIAAIAQWEAQAMHSPESSAPAYPATYRYYEHFAEALESVLIAKGVCDPQLLARTSAMLAARPAGHDHGHDRVHKHDHDHDHGHHH